MNTEITSIKNLNTAILYEQENVYSMPVSDYIQSVLESGVFDDYYAELGAKEINEN